MIVTFLMVFQIQKTQNRDTETIQLKLDELIRVTKGARNMMLNLEPMDDESLKRLRDIYERLGSQARTEKNEKIRPYLSVSRIEPLFLAVGCELICSPFRLRCAMIRRG
jgi:low affinity Fe/Cu permease